MVVSNSGRLSHFEGYDLSLSISSLHSIMDFYSTSRPVCTYKFPILNPFKAHLYGLEKYLPITRGCTCHTNSELFMTWFIPFVSCNRKGCPSAATGTVAGLCTARSVLIGGRFRSGRLGTVWDQSLDLFSSTTWEFPEGCKTQVTLWLRISLILIFLAGLRWHKLSRSVFSDHLCKWPVVIFCCCLF